MSALMDTTTIEDASRATGISLGTLGYWIVAGMLDATVTAQGRIVRLSDVRRVAAQLGAPGAPRELLIHQDRAAGPLAPLLATPPRDELLHELHERLERLDTQLQRVDQALTGQVGQLDRVETARAHDAEALQRVQQTLQEHGEALRRLESAQSRAAAEPAASPLVAARSEPPLVLRFRPIGTAEAAAPEAATQPAALRLTRAATAASAAPSTPAPPKTGFPFGLRAGFPRVPFMGRKAIRDNS